MTILFRTAALFFVIGMAGPTVSFAQPGWFWQNPLPQGNYLRATASLDASTVIVLGGYGTILRTTDRGEHWVRQTTGRRLYFEGVSMVDANTAPGISRSVLT